MGFESLVCIMRYAIIVHQVTGGVTSAKQNWIEQPDSLKSTLTCLYLKFIYQLIMHVTFVTL